MDLETNIVSLDEKSVSWYKIKNKIHWSRNERIQRDHTYLVIEYGYEWVNAFKCLGSII